MVQTGFPFHGGFGCRQSECALQICICCLPCGSALCWSWLAVVALTPCYYWVFGCGSGMNSRIFVSINIKLNSHSCLVSNYCIVCDFFSHTNNFSTLKVLLCLETVWTSFLCSLLICSMKTSFLKVQRFPEYLDYWGGSGVHVQVWKSLRVSASWGWVEWKHGLKVCK